MSELLGADLQRSKILSTSLDDVIGTSLLARESNVILGGLAAGTIEGTKASVQNLEQFGRDLVRSPQNTLVDFVSQHWTEAATAAALSFAAPGKMASLLIGAWSLRGLGSATLDAAKMAADTAVPLQAVKETYAYEVKEQSQALLASLPMTLVGASAGRTSANLVFGKNMSATDLLTKKLDLDGVKTNILNTYDQIRPPAVKLVVTDMDNTLLPTQKQQALGLEKAVGNLSKTTGIAEAELYESLGTVMERYHSHSYPWTLELALKDRLKIGQPGGISIERFNKQIAEPFWKTMDESLQHLEIYPGVRSTLSDLSARKIPVVVLSDASASSGLRRFTQLRLDAPPIERMYAIRNPAEPLELPEALRLAGRERLESALNTKHNLNEFTILPRASEKPAPAGLRDIMELYQVRPSQVLMIGDSIRRDMGVATQTGARGLLAKYATSEPAYEAILNRFKDPKAKTSFKDKNQTGIKYEDEIYSYRELSNYLKPAFNIKAIPKTARRSADFLLVPPLVLNDMRDYD